MPIVSGEGALSDGNSLSNSAVEQSTVSEAGAEVKLPGTKLYSLRKLCAFVV